MSVYVSATGLKATLNLSNQTFADADIAAACEAASRAVDNACGRTFTTATAATLVYTTDHATLCLIDDATTVTGLNLDTSADGTFVFAVDSSNYVLEPPNAAANSWPYTAIRLRPNSAITFPCYPQAVQVIGTFGWTATPGPVIDATSILAARLLKRRREAPFGIVSAGVEVGAVMRISRSDPDVYSLLQPYVRGYPVW